MEITFAGFVKKHLAREGETLQQLAAEMKKLTEQDRDELKGQAEKEFGYTFKV